MTPPRGMLYSVMKAVRTFAQPGESATMALTPTLPAPPETRPSEEQVFGMAFDQVVGELVECLGGPNVALIGGVSKTSLVADWIRGGRPKSDERAMRLRLALRLARILLSRFSSESVRAWFWGANRRLDDEAPIAVIAQRPLQEIQKDLLGAARWAVQG